MAAAGGARRREVVRLEAVAEQLAPDGTAAAGFAAAYADALHAATADAAGLKSVIAYRYGLDFDPEPPSAREVREAAGRWLRRVAAAAAARLDDPVLLRHVLWAGVDRGLPLQFHVGFGDPDLQLDRCDPARMTGFLRAVQPRGIAVLLLHCYPFHRAGRLPRPGVPARVPDVGLAVNYVGARAAAVLAESLELTPFHKVLYSSDAFGLAELHYLGAVLFRRAFDEVVGGWVDRRPVVGVRRAPGGADGRRRQRRAGLRSCPCSVTGSLSTRWSAWYGRTRSPRSYARRASAAWCSATSTRPASPVSRRCRSRSSPAPPGGVSGCRRSSTSSSPTTR